MKFKYNFDEIIDRSNTNCVKWDLMKKDVLPLWVADMDFKTAQPIIDTVMRKAASGIFGYTFKPEAYYEAIIYWWRKRHAFNLSKDWIVFFPGIVPALSMLVNTLLKPGEKAIIQTPVYHPFHHVIRDNGCQVVENPLILKDGRYEIDFADLEIKAADPDVKLMLLCSPHNPVGRVWTHEELSRLGEICIRNNVLIIADEIHCDLIYDGYKHIPFASLTDDFRNNSITCTAPSKTFNIAGLQVSNLLIPDKALRNRVVRALEISHLDGPNAFGVEALISAYTEGEEWLQQLTYYLKGNLDYLCTFFKDNLPGFQVIQPEGTYLVWVDCRALNFSGGELNKFLLAKAAVQVNEGSMFGSNGEGFIRINIACPRAILAEGLNRIKNAVENYITEK